LAAFLAAFWVFGVGLSGGAEGLGLLVNETRALEPPMTAKSLAHLYEAMAKEPPLKEADLKVYLTHIQLVMGLGQDPAVANQLMELSGWTEKRLIYSVTKINLGVLAIFDPDNPKLAVAPEFARPSAQEMETIFGHREDLERALTRLVARPGR
jgi:hypothetical protein